MKTQTKITILLLSVTLIFIAGLSIIKRYESKREELLLKKNIFDKNTFYDRISRLEVSTLETFVYDTSNTDDMVDAINSNDINKTDRIVSPFLSGFHVDAVWIYNIDLKLIYTTKYPSVPPVKDINIQKDFFPTLFSRSFFCHFFISTPMGIMEIQSAPVQPSTDTYRQTNPQGYLFAGRLWDEKYINELSFLTDSTIELLPIKDRTVLAPIYDIQKGILSFSRIRNGWDEKPLVQIKIENKTPLTKQLRQSSKKQFIFLLCFTLLILLMMTTLLIRWINLPLQKISLSLKHEDPEVLNTLKNENTEFGNLARLVLNFFNQKSELETSEERFRSVVQTAADAIICINQHGNIVFWNREAEYIFGYTYEEIVNKPAYIILSEKHKKDYENLITQLNIGNEINFSGRTIEVSGLNKDGSEFPMELSEASWKTDNGTFVTAIARDISERKHAETQLEKSEKRFRDIIENSFTGRFIVQNDRIVYTNTEQNILFGPVPDNYRFSDFKNIHPEDINKFKDFCDSLLSGNAVPLDIDFRFYPFDKINSSTHIKWVNCRGTLIDHQGKTSLFINMMDITRFMELEQLLRIEDKMSSLGRVAAGIAHEIRNPLTGINSYLYSLKNLADEYQNKKSFKDIIQEIQSASNKIESVIKRVMDFSKPGHLKLAQININDPVLEAINLSVSTLRKGGIIVDLKLAPELPPCTADSHMIEQVILNLINNSVQAMSSSENEKKLEIISSVNEKTINIRISDSGPGIAEEIRGQIFDPFYTTKNDGSGIGLSLCQRIITDHSGTISIETSSYGGASFVIELPTTVK